MDTDEKQLTQHISHQFNAELEDLRNRVMRMGGLVEQQIADSVRAIADADPALATDASKRDYQINAMEVEIDEECILILARRQPAASDLRLIITVIKTITDLERIGDEAEKIARFGAKLPAEEARDGHYTQVVTVGRHVREMVHSALDAFARLDMELAFDVAHEEQKVDQEYDALMRQLVTHMMEDPRTISASLEALWAARALERIGDHARNIAEYVIFLIKGKDIRHTDLDAVDAELHGKGQSD